MNLERQRVKIAVVCGWKVENLSERVKLGKYKVTNEQDTYKWDCLIDPSDKKVASSTAPKSLSYWVSSLPNYLKSLDAIHEAEKIIGAGDLGNLYIENLRRVCGCEYGDIWYIVHATAAQRAEAFLKTLDLWVENNEGEQ